MKIQAIKSIRYQGVEYKPGEEFEVQDMFGRDFSKRGLAKPVSEKKTKSRVE